MIEKLQSLSYGTQEQEWSQAHRLETESGELLKSLICFGLYKHFFLSLCRLISLSRWYLVEHGHLAELRFQKPTGSSHPWWGGETLWPSVGQRSEHNTKWAADVFLTSPLAFGKFWLFRTPGHWWCIPLYSGCERPTMTTQSKVISPLSPSTPKPCFICFFTILQYIAFHVYLLITCLPC